MYWPAPPKNVPYRNLADEFAWLSYDLGLVLSLELGLHTLEVATG